jgi:hypothetical protein
MNQCITVHYTPNQKDYESVLRLFFWQRRSTKLSLIALVVAFGLVLTMIASKGSPPSIFELIWLLLPPVFVLFVFVVQPSRIARQAAQNEQLITEATWEVNASGIQISSNFSSTLLEWESLDKLVTTRDYYLVLSKINKNAFRFIPRRAFPSPQEESEFLELVGEHLPKG